MQRKVDGSAKSANDAAGRLAKTLRRVMLLADERQIFKSKLSKRVKARDLAAAD